jgi:hypothetical protein
VSAGAVAKYEWLSEYEPGGLGDAGCVTVATPATRDLVLEAYDADLDERISLVDAAMGPVAHVAVVELSEFVVAYESNGYQGADVEVLERVSRHGKAANVFWNINGIVTFTCARRGRVLCSFDLSIEEIPTELPARLRKILTSASPDADLVAVAAAMAEAFTGVSVSPEDIATTAMAYAVHPRPADLPTQTVESCNLRDYQSALAHALASAPGPMQRAVTEWSAVRALDQAGLLGDSTVHAAVSQFGSGSAPQTTPAFAQRVAQIGRDHDRAEARLHKKQYEHPHDPYWAEQLETDWAIQRVWAMLAARYACIADDTSAALGAVHAALLCFLGVGAGPSFVAATFARLDTSRQQWPDMSDGLPTPLSPQQRADALDWATWKPLHREDSRLPALESWERNHEPLRRHRFGWGPLCDPDLVDGVETCDEPVQREIARWAARFALERAGLASLPWVGSALTALAAGQPLPAPFDDPAAAWAKLASDPDAPNRLIPSIDRESQDHQQAMALPVLAAAALPDPALAAHNALWYAQLTVGAWDAYYDELRRPLRERFGV